MNDLESRLNRYRPSGPPVELRARVVAASGATGALPSDRRAPWLSWLPAAAAAAIAILFSTLSANVSARLAVSLGPGDGARAAAVADLAAQLGNDPFAKVEAEQMIGNENKQAEQMFAVDEDLQVTK
jgi:hypothetical protein